MNSTSKLTSTFMVNAVLLCFVNVLFTFVGVFLNAVVMASLLSSQLRKKICYFMIFILAFSDIAIVAVFHPLMAVESISYWLSFESIILMNLEHLYMFSLTSLLTMSMERYFALTYPFLHEKHVTKTKLTIVLLLLQLPFVVVYLIQIRIHVNQTITLAPVGIVFLAICFLNLKLLYIAKRLRRRAVVMLGNTDGTEQRSARTKKTKVTLANVGTISTCVLIVLCLVICYCPIMVIFSLDKGNRADRYDQITKIIYLWTKTLTTLNSSFNCLIFFYKNTALRRHARELLRKCLGKKRLFHK